MKNVLKESTEKEPANILLQDEQKYEKNMAFIRQINSS